MIELEKIWQQFQPELEVELKRHVLRTPLPLYEMMCYHMGWIDERGNPQENAKGKRLRPILCLLACQLLGGVWRQALPGAAAIELLHNFSLIHDDIQDSSIERRGRPTVWHIWGMPQAITVGDGMYALAQSSLLRLEETKTPPQKVVRAAGFLNEACLKLCEGQYRDISYENSLDITTDDYLSMISGKTAALFRCSLEIGALIATDDSSTIEHLGNFGHDLGMTFQIQDDILGIWGDENTTGKSSASDIQMRKKTLPVIYALQNTGVANRKRLRHIYEQETIDDADVTDVLQGLNELDAKSYAQDMSKKYHQQALSELASLELSSEATNQLEAIATRLLNREY
ncbi:MAG: polyprenyl synthetase family protein [Chloroflexota bacterium]|nr:polyprenyl synthetase family protein [Chloroflexota bacterium]